MKKIAISLLLTSVSTMAMAEGRRQILRWCGLS